MHYVEILLHEFTASILNGQNDLCTTPRRALVLIPRRHFINLIRSHRVPAQVKSTPTEVLTWGGYDLLVLV